MTEVTKMKEFFESLYYVATVDNRHEEDGEEYVRAEEGNTNNILCKLSIAGVAVLLILQCFA